MAKISKVDDHGLEVLKKAAFILDDAVPTEYGLRTSATGTFSITGLTVGGSSTSVELNANTWTALPAAPLANRNAMACQNFSDQTIRINYITAAASHTGMRIVNTGERQYDVSDSIVLYGMCASGTCLVDIEELA